jgi:hypothetical protein
MKIIEVLKMVKPEEIVFGSLTIFTVFMNETSGIPGMICLLLLAFYYLIFSWNICCLPRLPGRILCEDLRWLLFFLFGGAIVAVFDLLLDT